MLLATANLSSPLFWEVFLGWTLTVAFHEFAHGLVAHLGGDYTIRERGGLSLNPLRYVDAMMSIVLPLGFMLMGGVPLPGGATFVRTDLLRNNFWRSAMSLAGPASNFLVLLLLLIVLHPSAGLYDETVPVAQWSDGHVFPGALAVLQAISIVLNLMPVPPCDGFNAVAPYLPEQVVALARQPMVAFGCLIVFFSVLTQSPGFYANVYDGLDFLGHALGMGPHVTQTLVPAARLALYGK
jgi:Zn-dependent protease